MKEKKCYISRSGVVVGNGKMMPQDKKLGMCDYPLDIHITATEEQLKNGRLNITINRYINNELYEAIIPNVKVDEFPIQYYYEGEADEPLDFLGHIEKDNDKTEVIHPRRYRPMLMDVKSVERLWKSNTAEV